MNEDFFADGVRHTLSDEGISMAFWLCTGYSPTMRLRDMRASSRGDLTLSLFIYGMVGVYLCVCDVHGFVKVMTWHEMK